jgi:hypothetical protein
MSLGYIGGGLTLGTPLGQNEISSELFDKRTTLLYGVGYDNDKQPMLIAKPNVIGHQPYVSGEGNTPTQNFGYAAGYRKEAITVTNGNDEITDLVFDPASQTSINLLNVGGNQTAYNIVSGNDLILYRANVFTTVRSGR